MLQYCTLASSSSGNAAFVTDGVTRLLIDLGISTRAAVRELAELGVEPGAIDAICITHEHGDHIKGLATWRKRFPQTPVYAPAPLCAALTAQPLPVECEVVIKSLTVTAFPTPHDTDFSVGYRISAGGVTLTSMTDLGHVPEALYPYIEGADLLLLEANYDPDKLRYGRYPAPVKQRIAGLRGHLSNFDCAACAATAVARGTKTVVLGHLSCENNTPRLAYETVHRTLVGAGVIPGVDMMLGVAPPIGRSELYVLK